MKILFILMLFLIPLRDSYSFNLFDYTIRFSELLWMILIMINILEYCINPSKLKIKYKNPLFWYYLLTLILSFISLIFFNFNTQYLIREIINVNFYVIGFTTIVHVTLSKDIKLITILKAIVYSSTFFSILALVNYFTGIFVPTKPPEIMLGFYLTRMIGFASEPAYWGSVLITPFAILFVMLVNNKKIDKFHIFHLIIVLINLLLTFSVFTYFSIAFIVVMTFMTQIEKKRTWLYIILGLLIIVISLTITNQWQLIQNMVNKVFDTDTDFSSRERAQWRIAAMRMFNSSPIFGHGVGSYGSLYSVYIPEYQTRFSDDANSYMLLQLAEKGLLGVLTIVLFFSSLLITKYRTLINLMKSGSLVAGLRYTMILIAILFTINFFIIGYLYVYYFFIYMAFGFALDSYLFKKTKIVSRGQMLNEKKAIQKKIVV